MIQPNSIFDFRIEPSFRTTWIVPENLDYFDGHFPGQPILPAIAVLDASVELLRSATKNSKLELKATSSAKFSQPILPGYKIEILAHHLKENNWDMEWRLTDLKQTDLKQLDLKQLDLKQPTGPNPNENRLADLRISF